MRVPGLFKPNVEKMEKRKDVDGLVKALGYNNVDVQKRAAEALGRLGEPAIGPLAHALVDKDKLRDGGFDFRYMAAEALGNTRHAKALGLLTQALRDEDNEVRRHTAMALGRMGDTRAKEPLTQALEDRNCKVRCEAAEALDELGWQPSVEVEKAHYMIAKAAWGELIILGEPGIQPLIQALKDEESFVREAAQAALEEIKANTAQRTKMTKKLFCVVIITREPFEGNEASIVNCVAMAFPEELEKFDPAAGTFTLRSKGFKSIVLGKEYIKKFGPEWWSWMGSVRKGVHYLPRRCDMGGIADSEWGMFAFTFMLESINPEFGTSLEFIIKWSVIDGKYLVIGIYSVVPQ